jgi:HEPN domain-containing protein
MKNSDEIKQLAYERLSEAQILCDNAKYDGAFYLAGYSIELMLKAKVCEHWGIPNLFDEAYQAHSISEVRKAIKTHDIAVLLIFSGLKVKFETAKGVNKVLMQTHARLFATSGRCLWSEQVRYHPIGSQNAEDVQRLMILLQHEEGLLKWIEKS